MGETVIQWTDRTWIPITGCTRLKLGGCDHCYAFQLHDLRHLAYKRGTWPTAPVQYHRPFSEVQVLADRIEEPFRWRTPQKVFLTSMGDIFHEDVPDDVLDRLFAVMALTPQHTYQVLTKRPEWMAAYLAERWRVERIYDHWFEFSGDPREIASWPLPNVWLGTSIENQAAADARIPWLLQTPAAVRFLSAEPLLGPVDLSRYLTCCPSCGYPRPDRYGSDRGEPCSGCAYCDAFPDVRGIDWVIAGGESGPKARPMHPDWARSLRDQCVAAGVPFFFKQWGAYRPAIGAPLAQVTRTNVVGITPDARMLGSGEPIDDPDRPAVIMCRVGKKAAGRELDGRTWDEYPAVWR